jgi:hypothetical protein
MGRQTSLCLTCTVFLHCLARHRLQETHCIQQRQKINYSSRPPPSLSLFLGSSAGGLPSSPAGRPATSVPSHAQAASLSGAPPPLSSRALPSPELLRTAQSPAAAISPRSGAEGRRGPSIQRRGAAPAPSPSRPAEVASIRPAASSGGGSRGPPPSPARTRTGLGAV